MSHYQLRRLPQDLRTRAEQDAREQDIPLLEVIRMILCAHYELDCEPTRGWIRNDAWSDAENIDLRMPPALYAAIKNDSAESGETMRALIIEALESHYQEATA